MSGTDSELVIAVGMALSGHPPHRSVRAELPHTAPTLDIDDQTALRDKDAGEEKVSGTDSESVPDTFSLSDDIMTLYVVKDLAVAGARLAISAVAREAVADVAKGTWAAVNEAMSKRAAGYQLQIGGRAGQAFVVNGVKFDAEAAGVLLEAKGPGYARFVKNGQFRPWFSGQQALVGQATRQVAAANGTPIIWHVAEQEAATAIQNLLKQNGVKGINVVFTPVAP